MCLYVTFSSFSVLYHFEHDRPFFQLEHVSSFIQDLELIAVQFQKIQSYLQITEAVLFSV